jgi:formylglycine-generating enzyme required for sulfatase activity
MIESPIRIESVRVPAGEFLMGSDPARDAHARGREQPQHSVYLPAYHIGKYPVTNAQYAAFAGADAVPPGRENHPVVGVSWSEAVAFCRWLRQESGQPFRLPSEAEWEKAARGTDGRTFPWGDAWDESRVSLEVRGLSDVTTTVGTYAPGADSPYCASDVVGNGFEWCSRLYKKYPYRAQDGREDLSAPGRRVLRSGPYSHAWWDLYRCAVRHSGAAPDVRAKRCGLRVAVSITSYPTTRRSS